MKNKNVAGTLALLFGIFGVHRFYLGQRGKGVMMIALFFVMFVATVEENAPFVMVPALIAFIDAILFYVMPKEDFDERYNYNRKKSYWEQRRERRKERQNYRKMPRREASAVKYPNPFKVSGLTKYKDYDYEGAIEDFQKALGINYKDPAVHFNLACCYSINEQTEQSFFHLDKAVEYGFEDFDRIHSHDALAFVRTTDDFDDFVENKYRMVAKLEAPKEDILSTPAPLLEKDILEKIASLGELRDKGFLTEEEFSLQKKRLLEKK